MVRSWWKIVVVLAGVMVWHLAAAADEPLEIGSRRELFVDRFLIDRMEGAALQLHSPEPANVVLQLDRPWEGSYCGYFTVIQDGSIFRMYYRGLPVLADGSPQESTCYAESPDGISWTRPTLGLYEVAGTRENNVILHGQAPLSHNFSPFLDLKPGTDHSQRFKALAGTAESGLIPFVSADGIHWQKLRDQPVITQGAFDSQNLAFWSIHEGCYVCFFRTFRDGIRSISRATSTDFLTWTEAEEMDYGATPREHLYTNQTVPYERAPHLYLSFPMRFLPGRSPLSDAEFSQLRIHPSYLPYARQECSDGVFLTSRGGRVYDRTFMEAFVRPGLDPGNWVSRTMMAALGIVTTGKNEMSLYYHQHDGQYSFHLRRYVLRTDGFASVSAPAEGGELLTKPLRFSGSQLSVNFATSAAGSLRLEVQDESGRPVPRYSLEDAVEQFGDETARVVTWKHGADVSRLSGRAVRLRFVLSDADLYSLQFQTPASP